MNNTTTGNLTWAGTHTISNTILFIDKVILFYSVALAVLTPLICVGNILLITAILSSKELRRSLPYLVIVSIALSDLISGLVICPVKSDTFLKRQVRHSCSVQIFVNVSEMFVQLFVGTWSLVMLNTHFLFIQFNIKIPNFTQLQKRILTGIAVVLPWFVMCFIIFPVTYAHAVTFVVRFNICWLSVTRDTRVSIVCISFIVPSITSAVQTSWIIRAHKQSPVTETTPGAFTISVWALVSANIVAIVLLLPEKSISLVDMPQLRNVSLQDRVVLHYVSLFVGDSKSAIFPLVWFACPRIRASCVDLYNKLPWRTSVDIHRSDFAVNYRNMTEEEATVA